MKRKTIRRAELEKAMAILLEVRDSSTLEGVNLTPSPLEKHTPPAEKKDVTGYVKSRVLPYMRPWITTPLNVAMEIIANEMNRK